MTIEQGQGLEYKEILPVLKEPRFSIDRLTMLVYSPGFSIYESDTEYDDLRGYRVKKLINEYIKFFDNLIKDDITEELKRTTGKILNSLETKLYQYHYRIQDIDIQFCTKLPKNKRISDDDYIEVWGDDRDKARGYMYEFYSNDYNVRIEYNPNKADISLIAKMLAFFKLTFYRDSYISQFLRITRVDFAFDYPEPVNPALVNFKRSRKHNVCGGSEGIETVYHGAQKSTFNLVVYDKKKEYLEKDNILYSGAYLWRVELRCHHVWYVQDLPEIGRTVLPRIEIFNAGLQTGDWQMDMALMVAVHWGIRNALAMMPSTTRERYLKSYRELNLPTIKHPGDLYLENFRNVWEPERNKILRAFGFEPSEFCIKAVSDSKL